MWQIIHLHDRQKMFLKKKEPHKATNVLGNRSFISVITKKIKM